MSTVPPELKTLLREVREQRDTYVEGVAALKAQTDKDATLAEVEGLLRQAVEGADGAVNDLLDRGAESLPPLRPLYRLLDSMARFGPFVLMSCLPVAAVYGFVEFFRLTAELAPLVRIPLFLLALATYPLLGLLVISAGPVRPLARRLSAAAVVLGLLALGRMSVVPPAIALALAISSLMANAAQPPLARVIMLANSASIRPILDLGYRLARALELVSTDARTALAPAIRSLAQLSLSGIEEALDLYDADVRDALAPAAAQEENAEELVAQAQAEYDAAREAHSSQVVGRGEFRGDFDGRSYEGRIRERTAALHAQQERYDQAKNRELTRLQELARGRFPQYRNAILTNACVALRGAAGGEPVDPEAISPLVVPGFDDVRPRPPFSTVPAATEPFLGAGPWRVIGALVLGALTISLTHGHPLLVVCGTVLGILVGPWLRFLAGLSFLVVGVAGDLWDRKPLPLLTTSAAVGGLYLVGTFFW